LAYAGSSDKTITPPHKEREAPDFLGTI